MIRLSVVMPVRDAAAFIGEAVCSIREQTLTEFELILVDDGCEDDSIGRARALSSSSRPS